MFSTGWKRSRAGWWRRDGANRAHPLGGPASSRPVFREYGASIGVTRVQMSVDEFRAAFEAGFNTVSERYPSWWRRSSTDAMDSPVGSFPRSLVGRPISPLPVTEIITDNAFFDYAAKYEGKSREVTPADLDAEEQFYLVWPLVFLSMREGAHSVELSVQVYRDLDCRWILDGACIGWTSSTTMARPTSWRSMDGSGLRSEMSIIPQQARGISWWGCPPRN